MKAAVFLGGGRITGALLAGLRLAKYSKPIVVYDRHSRKLRQLRKQYGVMVERNLRHALEQAQLLILAVRPDSVNGLLHEIGSLGRPLNAVSLAAGVPLAKLRARLGPPVRWARAMPSPVCRSGRGLTALTFERGFSRAARQQVKDLFAKIGPILEISENHFDTFTVTYSCSHGYHALAMLAGAAEKRGLKHNHALIAAAHALADGVVAWREGNVPLNRLLHEAATPAGIAASVMEAMDRAGYKQVVEQGLTAGLKRARKNAKRT